MTCSPEYSIELGVQTPDAHLAEVPVWVDDLLPLCLGLHMRCYYQWSPGHSPPHTHPALPGEVHVAALRLLPGDRGVGQQQSAGHFVGIHILPGLESSQVGGLTILGILELKHKLNLAFSNYTVQYCNIIWPNLKRRSIDKS